MKFLLLFIVVLLSGCAENGVYICTGSYSKRYHAYEDCKGLGNCRGDIINVSKEDAKKRGLTHCRLCY